MDLRSYELESPQREQSQPASPPDSDCCSPASIPEDTSGVDAKALKKQLDKELRALGRVSFSRSFIIG